MKVELSKNRIVDVEGLENAKIVELDFLGEKKLFIVAQETDLPMGSSENIIVSPEPVKRYGMYGWFLNEYGMERYRMVKFCAFNEIKVVAENNTTAANIITNTVEALNKQMAWRKRVEEKVKEFLR